MKTHLYKLNSFITISFKIAEDLLFTSNFIMTLEI